MELVPQKIIQQTSIDEVNLHHAAARNAACLTTLHAVLAGMELQKIKATLGHGHFGEFIKEVFEFSDRTARNYMGLADGVKGKALFKRQPERIRRLLTSAPSEIKGEDAEVLHRVIRKATKGANLAQLYQDFGIIKAPQGSGASGGGEGGKKAETPEPSLEEQLETARKLAVEDWTHLDRMLEHYGAKFTVLEPALVEAQLATLERMLAARRDWLKTPEASRKQFTPAEVITGKAKI